MRGLPSKVLGPERIWVVVPSLTRVPAPLMTPSKFVPGDASALEPTVKILPSRAMVDSESPARETMAWSSPERLRVEPSSRVRLLRPFSWGKASAALVFAVVPSVMRIGPTKVLEAFRLTVPPPVRTRESSNPLASPTMEPFTLTVPPAAKVSSRFRLVMESPRDSVPPRLL